MEEKKEGRTDPPKVVLKRFIILAVFLFLYVGVLRVRTISYMDDVIWIYSFSGITNLRPVEQYYLLRYFIPHMGMLK